MEGFPGGVLVVKNLSANAGNIRDVDSIPGFRRTPGGGHGNPLQYSLPGEFPWTEKPGWPGSIGLYSRIDETDVT